jgi:hypothetical protein
MKIKLVISLFFCCISVTAFAQKTQRVAIKIEGHVTSSQIKVITNAFLYINKFWADKGQSLSPKITKKYFSPDTTLIINGKTIYAGYTQFETHFKEVGKNIRGKIHFPLLEMIGVGNKLIVHFDEDISDNNGVYYPTNVMAIFTLNNGKIEQWEEVVNSNYFCQVGSSNVVYSK